MRWIRLTLLGLALGLGSFDALIAQDSSPPSGATVLLPRLGLIQTWTDNLRLTSGNRDAALVTTLSPGISLRSSSGALRGSLDYTLNGIAYVKSDQASQLQNALAANAVAELFDKRLFVDMTASIGQQAASAFGTQAVSSFQANANRREVANLSVTPSVRGPLSSVANYELRGSYTRTEVRGTSLGDAHGQGLTLRVTSAAAAPLGWSLLASDQDNQNVGVRGNRNKQVTAALSYQPDPEWSVGVNLGRERSDYLGTGQQTGGTAGLNGNWTPTPRTRLSADWQHHQYGNSHNLNFEHRMERSVWRLVDSDAVNLGNVGTGAGLRTNYDQYFLLFTSVEPDPVKRDALVRSYLQSLGLSPDAQVASGFLSAGPSRVRNQQFSVSLQGVRSTVTALLNRSRTTRLGSNAVVGDLAQSSGIEQRSYSLTAGHQLTPLSSLSLTLSRQQTEGDASSLGSTLTSVSLNWNARFGQRLSGQLGTRHVRFQAVTPYTENAVYANLSQQF